ncbi:hypothetical protein TNCV_1431501 [Trichonephila clavipes]|nr:hypothetical protein TNCV_1431501 [Trichonephila clavipes]
MDKGVPPCDNRRSLSGKEHSRLSRCLPKAEPLIAFMNEELKLEMNTNQNVSTANNGTVIDAVFQRFLNTLESQVYVPYFSYHKSFVSALPQIEQE